MSFGADHESRQARRVCQECRERKARFQFRGQVRADRDHVLCFACYRAMRDRFRGSMLSEVPPTPPIPKHFGMALTERQRAHRAAMLDNLRRQAGSRT